MGASKGGREVQSILKQTAQTIYSPGWQSKVARKQVENGRHPFQGKVSWNRTHSARLSNLNRYGWGGLFTSAKEHRKSLSETFVDYCVKFGQPCQNSKQFPIG